MTARKKFGVNLLPKTEFEISFWGRFLKWALTAGRYIIILTELVVIMAFMSRFKLDADLQILGDSIEGKKRILEALASFETTFRATQARLAEAKKLIGGQLNTGGTMDAITSKVPSQVSINTLTIEGGQVNIAGKASTEQNLGDFLVRLATDPTWKSVEIVNVTADPEGLKYGVRLQK